MQGPTSCGSYPQLRQRKATETHSPRLRRPVSRQRLSQPVVAPVDALDVPAVVLELDFRRYTIASAPAFNGRSWGHITS